MYRKELDYTKRAAVLAEDLCMRCANVAKHYEPTRNYLEPNESSDRDAAPERLELSRIVGQIQRTAWICWQRSIIKAGTNPPGNSQGRHGEPGAMPASGANGNVPRR